MIRFSSPAAVKAVAADATAGPAIAANNRRCAKDEGCRQ